MEVDKEKMLELLENLKSTVVQLVDETENLERGIAILLETDRPIATASLLYRKIEDSWCIVED